MDIKKRLVRILPNVKKMLIDRGYAGESIPNMKMTPHLDYKIECFLEDPESMSLDIFSENDQSSDYICFMNLIEKKIDRHFFNNITKLIGRLTIMYGMDVNNDNLTFIIVGKYITGDAQMQLIKDFETSNPCVRIFDEKKFYLNISDHFLVPKHTLYRQSYKELMDKLMISELNKLPIIMCQDAMARHLNFRDGDVIEIERNTLGKKLLHYRYCVDENYSFKKFNVQTSKKRKSKHEKEKIEEKNTKKEEIYTKETMNKTEEIPSKETEERTEAQDRFPWNKNSVMFYSKSKTLKNGTQTINLRYLSNFHKIEGGIEIEGNRYSTIEHFFQRKKYEDKYQKGKVAKSRSVKFQMDNEYDQPDAKTKDYSWGNLAKKKGNKKYMNLHNCSLSTQQWCDDRVEIMKTAIHARYEQDQPFKDIIDSLKGKELFHFERSGKSFWGGNRPKKLGGKIWSGQNNLGKILNELGSY